MNRRLWNAANLLTLSRFAAAPAMLWLLLSMDTPAWAGDGDGLSLAVLALLAATLLTDMFDGMVARAQNVVTDFGKIMDPVADSTFFLTLLFGLSASPRFHLSVWIPVLVLYREVAIQVLRRYAALQGLVLAAKVSGKAKMVIQSVLMTGALGAVALADRGLLPPTEGALRRSITVAGVLIVAVNLLSLADYAREVPRLARGKRDPAEEAPTENDPESDRNEDDRKTEGDRT